MVPPSPCVDDSKCHDIVHGLAGLSGTHSELKYILDMGDGAYLMFHNIQVVDSELRTTGTVLTFCEAPTPDLRRVRAVDCAAIGMACQANGSASAGCAMP